MNKESIKEETIMLSDLKSLDENIKKKNISEDLMFMEEEQNENNKEEKKELSPEIIEKNNKLKNESLELYYNINNQKKKELEDVFEQIKLKIKFDDKPRYLKKGQLYTLSKTGFAIYDDNLFKKIVEIKFEQDINPLCAIQLDNDDLVFACGVNDYSDTYEILIYRLKDKQYNFLQRIIEGGMGHLGRYVNYGHCSQSIEKVKFRFYNLKEISGNRFISINNHGFKIYSINEKNEYSIVSIADYLDGIKYIHEISENKFIICTSKTNRRGGGYFGFGYETNEIFIQTMELKEITKEEISKKLENLNQDGYHISRRYFSMFFVVPEKDKNFNDIALKQLIESLKYTCSIKGIMSFRLEEKNYLSNYVLLKKKYFIFMINNNIFIIDPNNGTILKRIILLIDGISDKNIMNLFQNNFYVQKWNNTEDNEFVLLLQGNAVLFELNDEDKENVKLKILNYSYFPAIKSINNINKLKEGNNKFYSMENDNNSVCFY